MAEGPQAVRSVVAVGAGFFTASLLGSACAMAFFWIAPELLDSQSAGVSIFVNACTVVFICLGGYITGRLAIRNPVKHALVTGLVWLAIDAALAPFVEISWYDVAFWLLVVPASALGGKLRELQVKRGG